MMAEQSTLAKYAGLAASNLRLAAYWHGSMSFLALVYLPVVSPLRLVRHFLANQSISFDTGIPPAYEVDYPTMVDQGGNGQPARVFSVRRARDLGPFACALLQQCTTFVCELQHDG
jgi:hypothetical protein